MAITKELQKQNIDVTSYRKYMVFDLECENHEYKGRKTSPFSPDNYIIMAGWKTYKDTRCWHSVHNSPEFENDPGWINIPDDVDVLVGHNIKFDLQWQWKNPSLHKFLERGGKIWCTQQAEYYLNGMREESQFVGMDDIAVKYGGRLKDDRVKKFWKKGGKTSQLDPTILEPYLIGSEEEGYNSGDIGNTELIYRGQFKRAAASNMLTHITESMDCLLATTEAEFNGLYVNAKVAYRLLLGRHRDFRKAKKNLESYLNKIPEKVQFNIGSGDHLSCLFFGGTIFYKEKDYILDEDGNKTYAKKKIDVQVYNEDGTPKVVKSGKNKGNPVTRKESVDDLDKPKMKYFEKPFTFKRKVSPDPEWQLKKTTRLGEPLYSTTAENLEALEHRVEKGFIKVYLEYAAIKKDLTTYYKVRDKRGGKEKGMFAFICENEDVIHHILNMASVNTGRMSSEKPNCQNIPREGNSRIKEVFTSRWEGGKVAEIDYSQLEVVVQGCLSKDPKLEEDLRNRVDFHCKRVELRYGKDYPGGYDEIVKIKKDESHPLHKITDERRTGCKRISFQKAYGAGARSISNSTGIPIEDIEAIMEAEDNHYSGVAKYYADVKAGVDSNQKYRPVVYHFTDKEGVSYSKKYQKLRGTYTSPTGRLYIFEGNKAPAWLQRRGIRVAITPTVMKNYPIQGTGGEMVQSSIGRMFRALIKEGYWSQGKKPFALFVNTVHDCVWFDFKSQEIADEVVPLICKHLEAIPEVFNKLYDMNIEVPFPVEAEIGDSMADLHVWDHHKRQYKGK